MNKSSNIATDSVVTKRRWLRRGLKIVAGLAVLLLGLYFVATSSLFLRLVVLPIASHYLGAKVTAEGAYLSPFSRIVLRGVKVQSTSTEPLLTAQEVQLRYHLREILRGNYHVEEAVVDAPVVSIITDANGINNLESLLKKWNRAASNRTSKPSAPPMVNIVRAALTNATVRVINNTAGSQDDSIMVSNLNLVLEHLQNDGSGKLILTAGVDVMKRGERSGTDASKGAQINGSFTFAFDKSMEPVMLKSSARLAMSKPEAAKGDIAGLGASLDCDLTTTNWAGAEGGNLVKNLFGSVNAGVTNINVDLNATRVVRVVVTTLSVAMGLPELTKAPITSLSVKAKINGGTANISQIEASSALWQASSEGKIFLDEPLTNSRIDNLPVSLALPEALAHKSGMTLERKNEAYMKLGKLATVGGTIGAPDVKINYPRIALLTGTKAIERLPGAVSAQAGRIVNGAAKLGESLKGGSETNTDTNQPPPDSATKDVFNWIKARNPFQKRTDTN